MAHHMLSLHVGLFCIWGKELVSSAKPLHLAKQPIINSNKHSLNWIFPWMCWHTFIVPDSWRSETEGLIEPSSSRLTWAIWKKSSLSLSLSDGLTFRRIVLLQIFNIYSNLSKFINKLYFLESYLFLGMCFSCMYVVCDTHTHTHTHTHTWCP